MKFDNNVLACNIVVTVLNIVKKSIVAVKINDKCIVCTTSLQGSESI